MSKIIRKVVEDVIFDIFDCHLFNSHVYNVLFIFIYLIIYIYLSASNAFVTHIKIIKVTFPLSLLGESQEYP